MLKEYTDYIKDNPKGLWFKRKLYGWGWTPVKWQGWLVIAAFIGFVLWLGTTIDPNADLKDLNWFFTKLGIAIFLLIFICYKKGEKPRWQWGIPKETKENDDKKN